VLWIGRDFPLGVGHGLAKSADLVRGDRASESL
jgi:hypothetical protein